ncbi:cupin domain-containing protein [Aquabacter spiritensis]|uniref:Quercetin dioxygenase-like cupin family protein n=1 Tax=Aquabacter spiritensis TaxID=933073 RepID=A0A4R3LSI8_9HYPH|nr:cupin domain-containing protein [Aquabacter spiritensis]TCT03524.1 quercetin dioxygenase-like cupin family protein [Aquabacter spiritensis]
MFSRRRFVSCAICTAVGFVATGEGALAQGGASAGMPAPGGIVRTMIETTEYPGPGHVTILMTADVEAGGVIARHIHPGVESTYLVTGGAVLSIAGRPDRTLVAGDGFQIPPEVPHSIAIGPQAARLAITYVVEKGKPLSSPAPAT